MTPEELENRVRESGTLAKRLDKCRAMIGEMCKAGRPPRMSIPLRWDDEDFFINTTLRDAEEMIEHMNSKDGISGGG